MRLSSLRHVLLQIEFLGRCCFPRHFISSIKASFRRPQNSNFLFVSLVSTRNAEREPLANTQEMMMLLLLGEMSTLVNQSATKRGASRFKGKNRQIIANLATNLRKLPMVRNFVKVCFHSKLSNADLHSI